MRLLLLVLVAAWCRAGEVSVLAWNVLFDDDLPRYRRLIAEVARLDPEVAVFAEVTPAFIAELRASPLGSRSFVIGNDRAGYTNVVLSRLPVTAMPSIPLPSRQGRHAVVARVALPGDRRMVVVGIHLESSLTGGELRARQLASIAEAVTAEPFVLIVGDANFGTGERDDAGIAGAYREILPAAESPSWDVERNPRAAANSFPGESSRRIDRAWTRGLAGTLEVLRLAESDHYPLMVRVAQ